MHRRSVRSLLVWHKAFGVKLQWGRYVVCGLCWFCIKPSALSCSGAAMLVCDYMMSITVPT